MASEQVTDIWAAIEGDPNLAHGLRLRSYLMMALSEHIKDKGLTQVAAAKLMGVEQPRISDLVGARSACLPSNRWPTGPAVWD